MVRDRRTSIGLVVVLALAVGCGGTAGTSAGEVEEIDLAAMDAYGCGFGFWLGTPEQDVAIHIAVADPAAATRGDISDQAVFPDEAWEATVRVGRDLFANWCDDVIEADEPEPVIDQQWPITAGTLTLQGQPPEPGCVGALTATVQGLEATRPDSTTIELGDREVTNDAWGCFAG